MASTGFVNGYDGEVIKKTTFATGKDGTVKGKASQSRAKGAKAVMQKERVVPPSGTNIGMKIDLLRKEGVRFDEGGMLLKKGSVMFDGPWEV